MKEVECQKVPPSIVYICQYCGIKNSEPDHLEDSGELRYRNTTASMSPLRGMQKTKSDVIMCSVCGRDNKVFSFI
jgi:hypothetical protein